MSVTSSTWGTHLGVWPADHWHTIIARYEVYIRSDPQEVVQKIAWTQLIPLRQTWTFAIGKFLTDPVWWFYLFWMPGFFQTKHGLSLTRIGPPLIAIYVIADVGSVVGGWISSFLIRRGRSINAARKIALLICAVGVTPVVFAYRVESTWSAVLLIGLAAACHQGFSANLYTITSDMFPSEAVGSVTGMGGMAILATPSPRAEEWKSEWGAGTGAMGGEREAGCLWVLGVVVPWDKNSWKT